MQCKRCETIQKITIQETLCYVSLPTYHHELGFESLLSKHAISFEKKQGFYLAKVGNFPSFIRVLSSKYNTLEQQDMMILPLKGSSNVDFYDLHLYKTLLKWVEHFEADTLRDIIEHKRLAIHFQPIIDLKDLTIHGYEALMRGVDTDGNIISPHRLLTTARKADLLFNLDKLARETIIFCAAKQGIKNYVFINFLPTAIYNPELCLATTNEAIKKSQLNPNQIVFEVVESERVEDYEHLNTILDYYKRQGYQTALDDVGSGFNNLDTITKIQPNYIKIDQSMIRDIHLSTTHQATLGAYLTLAKKLGIKVLAEGIEVKEEMEYVKAQGVDYGQGYYFGKPQENI